MARKTTAKTRVKLSQAAKRRRRGPKGSALGGRFLSGVGPIRPKGPFPASSGGDYKNFDDHTSTKDFYSSSGLGIPKSPQQKEQYFDRESGNIVGEGKGRLRYRAQSRPEVVNKRTAVNMARAEVRQRIEQASGSGGSLRAKDAVESELLRKRVEQIMGIDALPKADREKRLTNEDLQQGPIGIGNADLTQIRQDLRHNAWRNQPVYDTGKRKPTGKFIREEMAPDHAAWLRGALADTESVFNKGLQAQGTSKRAGVKTPGAGHRLDVYVRQLQEGKSHTEALAFMEEERRGGGSMTKSGQKRLNEQRASRIGSERQAQAKQLLDERHQRKGRRGKYDSLAPSQTKFKFGIEVPKVDTVDSIRKRMPGLSEQDYVNIQEAQRRTVFDDVQKNTLWNHETRRARYLGTDAEPSDPDRVTFFTTNWGSPSVSVPAASLVGQYIIKRRKNMLVRDRLATPNELKGMFPKAVRDMHLIETASGVSGGLQGSYGLFTRTGFRAGSKKSTGFSKSRPLGATVMTDNGGRPMYDSEGNLRYTEGLTRPVTLGTTKEFGLRVFVG